MRYKLSKELKQAISNLPETEKDKLIFKLLPANQALCEKLEFELLEEGATVEERRQTIIETIEQMATGHHYSAGWLMMDMRTINAEIGRHAKRTNDKEGEILLLLHLLNRTFDEQMRFLEELTTRSQNLAEYMARRTQDIIAKLHKLHPDLLVEYESDVNKLLQRLYHSAAKGFARKLELPTELG